MGLPAKWMMAVALIFFFAGSTMADDLIAPPTEPTQIDDWEAFDRIINNRGMSLQWIGYDSAPRGKANAVYENRTISLTGEQRAVNGVGRVSLSGAIVRVSRTEFIFRGTIIIADTPDEGRYCTQTKDWRFAITQNRKYWRLRDFEWCDSLTDYIDIYF